LFIILAAIVLLISLVLDIFDGILARLRGPTLFGGIFDIFSDRIVEILVIIGIVLTDPSKLSIAGLVTVSSIVLCITIFLLLGNINPNSIPKQKKMIFYARGMVERTETGIFLLILICIPVPIIRLILFYSFSGLVLITTIQRFIIAYRVLRVTENNNGNNP
jgi:phosphatidylglycerophosphate synthase